MAAAKEIRVKIASVKNTQKITRAMELVAASKMKRAQERMAVNKPYAHKILEMVSNIAASNTEYRHSFLTERPVQKIGIILVSSDRGLCGGLNTNLFKRAIALSQEWKAKGATTELCLMGSKGIRFFKSTGGNVISAIQGLGDKPALKDLIGPIRVMLAEYETGKIDRLYVVYNQFVNTMTQAPRALQLLPVIPTEDPQYKKAWDYIYEPSPQQLLDAVLMRFIESQVYQAVVENNASEQAARMVAMKAATDNAGGMIKELKLIYNKARQASITQELAEIVGGASAV